MLQILFFLLCISSLFASNDPFLPNSPTKKAWTSSSKDFLIGGLVNPANGQFSLAESVYEVGTNELKAGKILFVNGINNNLEDAMHHASKLSNLGGDVKITGIHNKTNTIGIDLLECSISNLYIPFIPSFLLHSQMRDFHNTRNPEEKMMILSTSAGSIHVRNALKLSTDEIRNRVISLAIAPAAIINDNLCFDSSHFATAGDYVVLWTMLNDPFHAHKIKFIDSAPGAPKFDHSIDSPTYKPIITLSLDNYMQFSGGCYEN